MFHQLLRQSVPILQHRANLGEDAVQTAHLVVFLNCNTKTGKHVSDAAHVDDVWIVVLHHLPSFAVNAAIVTTERDHLSVVETQLTFHHVVHEVVHHDSVWGLRAESHINNEVAEDAHQPSNQDPLQCAGVDRALINADCESIAANACDDGLQLLVCKLL